MPTFTPPTFPLSPNFENAYSAEAKTNKTQYNDGGVIQRELIGINTVRKIFKFEVGTDKITEIEDFFALHLGKPFLLSYDGGLTTQPELWRISSYKWQFYSPTVRGLSCEMEQVRRFR